jgi:hypothetical protein
MSQVTRRKSLVTAGAAAIAATSPVFALGVPRPVIAFTRLPYPASILSDWQELGLNYDDTCIDVCSTCPDGYYLGFYVGEHRGITAGPMVEPTSDANFAQIIAIGEHRSLRPPREIADAVDGEWGLFDTFVMTAGSEHTDQDLSAYLTPAVRWPQIAEMKKMRGHGFMSVVLLRHGIDPPRWLIEQQERRWRG